MFNNLFVNLFRRFPNAKQGKARLQIENQNTSDESVLAQDVPPRHPAPIPRAEDSSVTLTNNGLLQSEAFLPPAMTIDGQRNLGVHVLYEPPTGLAPIVDIVFVHGLKGNSLGTWRSSYETGGVHWPRDLLKVDIPDARIIGFGYDASVHNWSRSVSQNRIGNHAQDLLGSVVRLREETGTEHLRLIFVTHSMGGLVVQNALDLSRSSPESHLNGLESNTAGLVFMGTPHFGSDAARWGRYYTNILGAIANPNQNIIGVLERNSEVLATIQNRFHGVLRLRQANEQPILITCFYEELASPVVGTVRSGSQPIRTFITHTRTRLWK
jgi:pimeloyl-ACP methyl ester carboxylesterase